VAERRRHGVVPLLIKAGHGNLHRVCARRQLRKLETARAIGLNDALQSGFVIGDRYEGMRYGAAASVAHLAGDGAGGFTLSAANAGTRNPNGHDTQGYAESEFRHA
jgi:hypothetical protein